MAPATERDVGPNVSSAEAKNPSVWRKCWGGRGYKLCTWAARVQSSALTWMAGPSWIGWWFSPHLVAGWASSLRALWAVACDEWHIRSAWCRGENPWDAGSPPALLWVQPSPVIDARVLPIPENRWDAAGSVPPPSPEFFRTACLSVNL